MRPGIGGSALDGGRNRMSTKGQAPRPKIGGDGGTYGSPSASFPCPSSLSHQHFHFLTASASFADYKVDDSSLSFSFSRPLHSRNTVAPGARIGPVAIRPSASLYGISGGSPAVTTSLQARKATSSGMRDGPASPRDHLAPVPSSHAPLKESRVWSLQTGRGRIQASGFRLRKQCEGARVRGCKPRLGQLRAVSPSGPRSSFLGCLAPAPPPRPTGEA